MSAPTWAKVVGVGALVAGAAGIAALVMQDDESGTVPPDEIEEDDDLENDDAELLVESEETVPGIFKK
jgi:hypothetical protein